MFSNFVTALPLCCASRATFRAGMDPDLATATTKQIQRELLAAHTTITAWEPNQPSRPLSAADINRPSTTLATSPSSSTRPSAKRGPGSTGPPISFCTSTLSETLRPWTYGCSYLVAGAGFEPATFGL